jgi:hypothetical protein
MPKILYSVPAGTPFAPRWRIEDEDGNYWDEKNSCWTKDVKQAGLFLTSNEAGRKIYVLMQTQVPGKLTKFALPFTIEVKGHNPVSVEELQEWLAANVEIHINGVLLKDSMVIVTTNYDLEEIPNT